MDRPYVSIIIPVLNTKPYLIKCLDSLLGQTIQNIEIICVDNGSTDGSLELLRRYEKNNQNIIVIEHPPIGRLGGARNAGIEIANGEFIGFVDSDDFVSESMFNELYSAACETTSELAICNVTIFFQKDNRSITAHPKQWLQRDSGFNILDRPKLLRNLTCWNKLYSSKLISRLNLRFPEGSFHEDQFFVTKAMISARKIVALPESHYFYRKQREGAISLYQDDTSLHIFTVMRTLSSSLKDLLVLNEYSDLLSELKCSRYLQLFHLTGRRFKYQFFTKMSGELRQMSFSKVPKLLTPSEMREISVINNTNFAFYRYFLAIRKIYGSLRKKGFRKNWTLWIKKINAGVFS